MEDEPTVGNGQVLGVVVVVGSFVVGEEALLEVRLVVLELVGVLMRLGSLVAGESE